ncbi:large ribosomal subunit protein mL63-like [Saccostrea echinata]|uniref:large ribosomal subunit protein mL63-like n=1 Tax=Saccostrea echinata TaxID=191078 RepID=UPI002A82FA71|nr:large ribosomal subunit protein mL63-like [Saccostrea echinata]
MHLTRVLQYFKKRPKWPGLVRAGKKRLLPVVSPTQKANAIRAFIREETNVKILQNPYLTMEEEHGYMKELGKPHEKFQKMMEEKKQKKWPKDVSMKDYLEHLNVTKSWE